MGFDRGFEIVVLSSGSGLAVAVVRGLPAHRDSRRPVPPVLLRTRQWQPHLEAVLA
jgi:hypothetical protein